jgi:hypothetical protein
MSVSVDARAEQSLAANGATACFSSSLVPSACRLIAFADPYGGSLSKAEYESISLSLMRDLSLPAVRAPQLKASVSRCIVSTKVSENFVFFCFFSKNSSALQFESRKRKYPE